MALIVADVFSVRKYEPELSPNMRAKNNKTISVIATLIAWLFLWVCAQLLVALLIVSVVIV
jgi:type VI protein secretion system component VasF